MFIFFFSLCLIIFPLTLSKFSQSSNPQLATTVKAFFVNQEKEGKSDPRSLFTLSAYQGQTHEFSPDCSEPNVGNDLQHNVNPKSPVSPGLVIRNQHNKDNEILHLYKNQLQSYFLKNNLSLPVYSSEWEGPPHAMRFKCKVTVNGQTYESHKFFSTLKDAEHAAAEVALMSLSPSVVQEGHAGLYKNLLQELAQKEGFRLPSYNTNISGEPHMPIFVSQVEVEGKLFTGQEAKSKKQAEMSAAKVAYMALRPSLLTKRKR